MIGSSISGAEGGGVIFPAGFLVAGLAAALLALSCSGR